jgi:hypothetical protein
MRPSEILKLVNMHAQWRKGREIEKETSLHNWEEFRRESERQNKNREK